MEAEDFTNAAGEKVDRLTAVKEVLDDFLTRREGDRVGLIVFGNAAFVQVPFTQDLDACRMLLEETAVRMAGPRTAFGDAIGLGITLFERSEVEDRVMIALTDGNDTGSKVPPAEAAKIARDNEIQIHVVGVGDPSSVGEEALDEEALEAVAETTGGRYFFAQDRDELEAIYTELDRIGTRDIEAETYRPRLDRYHWPLAVFLMLSLLLHMRAPDAERVARAEGRSWMSFISSVRCGCGPWSPPCSSGSGCGGFQTGPRRGRRSSTPTFSSTWWSARRSGGCCDPFTSYCPVDPVRVAMAGPSWEREPSPFADDTAGLVVLLKASTTMEATDVQPSRLERSKHKLRDLLELVRARPRV